MVYFKMLVGYIPTVRDGDLFPLESTWSWQVVDIYLRYTCIRQHFPMEYFLPVFFSSRQSERKLPFRFVVRVNGTLFYTVFQ